MTFRASPPQDVSFYLPFKSAPVSCVVLIAWSMDTCVVAMTGCAEGSEESDVDCVYPREVPR